VKHAPHEAVLAENVVAGEELSAANSILFHRATYIGDNGSFRPGAGPLDATFLHVVSRCALLCRFVV
jgi:hypothetical protein